MLNFVVPDAHFPFVAQRKFDALLADIDRVGPAGITLLGDYVDLHTVSSHKRHPDWYDRLEFELEAGRKGLRELRAVAKKAEITYICGNHEKRFETYIEKGAPALRHTASFQKVMQLDRLNIRWHDARKLRKGVRIPCGQGQVVYCFHGDEVKYSCKVPGGTALNFATKFGKNIHIGHTHRLGVTTGVVGNRTVFGVEGGYLGNPKSAAFDFMGPAPSNWQHSWAIYDSNRKDTCLPYLVRA